MQTVACQKDKCASALMGALGLARDEIDSSNLLNEAREFFLEYSQEKDT